MKNYLFKILKSGKIAPLLSGLLIVLAFPPLPFGFFAWFALLPLIASFYYDDFHFGFEKGFIYGVILNLGVSYWLAVNQGTQWYYTTLSMIATVLFLSFFYGIAGSIVGFIGRRGGKNLAIISIPIIFTSLEWTGSLGVMGFTWNNLCYTQSNYETIIQVVSFVGPFGLSMWIYLLNVSLFLILIKSTNYLKLLISLLIIVFIFPIVFGFLILKSADKNILNEDFQKLTVTVVQPNVDPNEKWEKKSYRSNMDKLFDLSKKEIIKYNSDLLVWPETAVPTYIRQNRRNSHIEINRFLNENSISLITGVPDYEYIDEDYVLYNSVFFMNPDKKEFEVYRKMHLVPFGEYIPLSEHFDNLKKLNLGQGNFVAGKEITVFNLKNNEYSIPMTAAICFESSFSSLLRKGVEKGSQLIAIVTNDAWFGNSSAPYLHAEIAKFRAVENHVPVVRAANTGISMIIDKYGRVKKKTKFGETNAISAEINISKEITFYSQTGNWIGVLCVIVVSILIIIIVFRRKDEN